MDGWTGLMYWLQRVMEDSATYYVAVYRFSEHHQDIWWKDYAVKSAVGQVKFV